MTKTRRQIQETIRQVDVVIELLDARIPLSSRNPDIDWLVGQKPRVIAMNKTDLADEAVNRQWEAWFRAQGMEVVYTNSLSGAGVKEIHRQLKALTAAKLASAVRRGRLSRPIRTMVVGIPNVGKSAFINRIAGKAIAATGDKPGVTRAQQWVRIHPEIQLLDTPGILWPKFEDQETGLLLAFTGAIRDDIMDTAELAAKLMARMARLYPARLAQRYKLASLEDKAGMDLLLEAGRKRGCLVAGGEVDLHRISAIVLDEFRGAKLGRISLERPPEKTAPVLPSPADTPINQPEGE
jgi:ribosome biogenesis GTPase A